MQILIALYQATTNVEVCLGPSLPTPTPFPLFSSPPNGWRLQVTFYVGGEFASMESVPTPRSPPVREGRGRVKFCVGSITSLDEGSPVPSSGARNPTTPPPPPQLANAPPR